MIYTGQSIFLPNGKCINLIGMTEEEIEEALKENKADDTPILMETPYGNWTPYGFRVHKGNTQFNLNTNLKLGTVLEFQRQIREHIEGLLTKVEDPKLRREIDEINYIYIHLLEHI